MANDDSTRAGFDLSPWRGKDPLSIFQAAWLWAGIPPTLPALQENEARYGRELAAARGWLARLEDAAKAGELPYEKPVCQKKVVTSGRFQPKTHHWENDWPAALVARADLRAFAESIGQRPAFLFPDAVDILAPRCLEEGPHFSGELAAALLAWQYASNLADGSKKKPRALIVEWLKTNRPQYGEGGKAFERIATLANWEKTTGPKRMG
jgi:hypothetical protein